jgi:AraC family transcriptional regulator, regulatory protein of adaptative response / methylated-DNA-[protein]-cysteine methyltransferase
MDTHRIETGKRTEMMRALMDRDRTFDGLFFAEITTTMIFCRPSCPAKKPKPEHVEFYDTAKEALFAGFRPCRRCRPLQPTESAPAWVDALIERVEADPSKRIPDHELRTEGLDPAAVRRHFLKSCNMTFQAYCRSRRLGAAFSAIRSGASIDDAVFGYSWESHSGFREAFTKAAAVPPGKARTADFIRLAWIDTPLGPMAAGATEKALCLLEFTDRRMIEAQLVTVKHRFHMPLLPGDSPIFELLKKELAEYFDRKRTTFSVPFEYPGTDFQRRVWDALIRIPFGETRRYADLAKELGVPGAARAVGHANGLNRIAILIPCHRVINADGGLGGYGGGLWRKLRLLETERRL